MRFSGIHEAGERTACAKTASTLSAICLQGLNSENGKEQTESRKTPQIGRAQIMKGIQVTLGICSVYGQENSVVVSRQKSWQ